MKNAFLSNINGVQNISAKDSYRIFFLILQHYCAIDILIKILSVQI